MRRIAFLALVGMIGATGPGQAANKGIWITDFEIQNLPMSGPAWDALKAQADSSAGTPNLSDQDQMNNVYILAKALVYARTQINHYRTEVRDACMAAIGTEADEPPNNPNGVPNRTMALGRELAAYVIAADIVGLKPASQERPFKDWLRRAVAETLDGKTLQSTHEERPNNWGTACGASRAAVAAYLGDKAELARIAQVFKGYLGDRSSYAGFEYSNLSWQADATNPVGINPLGAMKNGLSVDGVIPDDMARGCDFQLPPCHTGYPWEALQGATVQAEILRRQGYDTWHWQDRAVLRSVQYLYDLNAAYGGWWAEGDDEWTPWLINSVYGTSFPVTSPASPGKIMGWTDWTHNRSTVAVEPIEGQPSLRLERPTPNPAFTEASLSFSIPRPGPVRLEALDVSGRCVATLVSGSLSGGSHIAIWRLTSQASGIYFLRLSYAGQRRCVRVAVLR